MFKGDQIVSINGRALAGVSHNSAIKMLQKAKGHVELKLIRTGSPAGPPPDVQPINMALDDKVCNKSTSHISIQHIVEPIGI